MSSRSSSLSSAVSIEFFCGADGSMQARPRASETFDFSGEDDDEEYCEGEREEDEEEEDGVQDDEGEKRMDVGSNDDDEDDDDANSYHSVSSSAVSMEFVLNSKGILEGRACRDQDVFEAEFHNISDEEGDGKDNGGGDDDANIRPFEANVSDDGMVCEDVCVDADENDHDPNSLFGLSERVRCDFILFVEELLRSVDQIDTKRHDERGGFDASSEHIRLVLFAKLFVPKANVFCEFITLSQIAIRCLNVLRQPASSSRAAPAPRGGIMKCFQVVSSKARRLVPMLPLSDPHASSFSSAATNESTQSEGQADANDNMTSLRRQILDCVAACTSSHCGGTTPPTNSSRSNDRAAVGQSSADLGGAKCNIIAQLIEISLQYASFPLMETPQSKKRKLHWHRLVVTMPSVPEADDRPSPRSCDVAATPAAIESFAVVGNLSDFDQQSFGLELAHRVARLISQLISVFGDEVVGLREEGEPTTSKRGAEEANDKKKKKAIKRSRSPAKLSEASSTANQQEAAVRPILFKDLLNAPANCVVRLQSFVPCSRLEHHDPAFAAEEISVDLQFIDHSLTPLFIVMCWNGREERLSLVERNKGQKNQKRTTSHSAVPLKRAKTTTISSRGDGGDGSSGQFHFCTHVPLFVSLFLQLLKLGADPNLPCGESIVGMRKRRRMQSRGDVVSQANDDGSDDSVCHDADGTDLSEHEMMKDLGTPLLFAITGAGCCGGALPYAQLLIEYGADVEISVAEMRRKPHMKEMLSKFRRDLLVGHGKSSSSAAASIVLQLHSSFKWDRHTPPPHYHFLRPLQFAVLTGKGDVARLLVHHGCELNTQFDDFCTLEAKTGDKTKNTPSKDAIDTPTVNMHQNRAFLRFGQPPLISSFWFACGVREMIIRMRSPRSPFTSSEPIATTLFLLEEGADPPTRVTGCFHRFTPQSRWDFSTRFSFCCVPFDVDKTLTPPPPSLVGRRRPTRTAT